MNAELTLWKNPSSDNFRMRNDGGQLFINIQFQRTMIRFVWVLVVKMW